MTIRQQVLMAFEDIKYLGEGLRFQIIIRQLLMRGMYPNLIPHPFQNDLGQDATAELYFSESKSLSCTIGISLTPSWTKLNDDCLRCSVAGIKMDRFVFVTWGDVSKKRRREWSQIVTNKYSWKLQVLDSNWIIDQICKPENEDLLQNELGIFGDKHQDKKQILTTISKRSKNMSRGNLL